ncbi:MAG: 3,4-dihydroxy-2-butanone-4-phosphate synthase [Burkholderiales bacterium]|nr:3,4-dihydroxy-2-butanone-4-phosphate synthase [Burkholderiales bacterium]
MIANSPFPTGSAAVPTVPAVLASLASRNLAHPGASPPGPLHEKLLAAAQAMREGRPVLLTDDGEREDEADLIVAAETLTVTAMATMIRDGSGIVCLCLAPAQAAHLGLAPMVRDNRSRYGTAFTVSIEASDGVSTGVSAADRVTTVRAATEPGRGAADIVSPGHVFPLVAHEGGVLARRGHTEGALALCALAGLRPAAVLCELMNPDGTMARGAQMRGYAQRHGLPVLAIDDLVEDLVARRRL